MAHSETFFLVTISSRSSLIVADALVVVATWASTYSTLRMTSVAGMRVPSFSRLLFVNGENWTFTVVSVMHV